MTFRASISPTAERADKTTPPPRVLSAPVFNTSTAGALHPAAVDAAGARPGNRAPATPLDGACA